eukprot:UN31229
MGGTEPGTVKYIGDSSVFPPPTVSYGIEFDHVVDGGGDGIYGNMKYFDCKEGTSMFVKLFQIKNRSDLVSGTRISNAKSPSFSPQKATQTTFIKLSVQNWPLGFMFQSTSTTPDIIKIFNTDLKSKGLEVGMRLQSINGKK